MGAEVSGTSCVIYIFISEVYLMFSFMISFMTSEYFKYNAGVNTWVTIFIFHNPKLSVVILLSYYDHWHIQADPCVYLFFSYLTFYLLPYPSW